MITAEVSIGTVCKAIHELGKHSCIAVKKPYLTENHMACRLRFARDHQHWTVNDWRAVIWTDESVFELGKKSMQTRSVMIWGVFCGQFQSNLIILPTQQRTAQNFVDNVYIPGLIPFIEELEELGLYKQENLILMEDGAPIHSAQSALNGEQTITFKSSFGRPTHRISTPSRTSGSR
ncbi:hypothetical protein O181_017121 [Austropuccinia psidii MF-1]|uniref:Transposase Tc1-like domain-containing protein n=1 Tax=Austropuccinia psidii MF-1 TaxID=1389203 RepID=A0A9Q3C2X2_9BASI|nr:hypothetical protein [Austropuccinia psidii MF-1]